MEALERRELLAVTAVNDTYTATEDIRLQTGFTELVSLRSSGGWAIFDDIPNVGPNANTYPDTNQAARWFESDYNVNQPSFGQWDGAMGAGLNAPFIYNGVTGIEPAGTPIDAPSSEKTTVLARKTFTATAIQAQATTVLLQFLCDDACAFWLNDVFLGSIGLPAGFTPSTPATTAADENDYQTVDIGPALIAGTNVLAVEVHNGPGSSDLGFDVAVAIEGGQLPLRANDTTAGSTAPIAVFYYDGTVPPATVTATSGPVFAPGQIQVGTVAIINADGDIFYQPVTSGAGVGYSGPATFQYVNRDSSLTPQTSIGTVTINIAPVNDAPIANPEQYVTAQGAAPLSVSNALTSTTYISAGSTWNYSHNGSNQDSQNPEWKAGPGSGFNPGSGGEPGWIGTAGAAPLGFGDTPAATTALTAGAVTYYFHKTFNVAGTIPGQLRMGLRRDDCAVVYINGVEVHRSANMPTGQTFTTECAAPATDGHLERLFHEFTIPTAGLGLLASGNTIAVEVHQAPVAAGTVDLSFDLSLRDGNLGLLANDSDADDPAAQLSVQIVDQSQFTPQVGTLSVQPNGTFTFTPAGPGVAGVFSFKYQVRDDGLPVAPVRLSDAVTATITVTPASYSPITAVNDTGASGFTTAEDTQLVVNAASGPTGPLGVGVLANDVPGSVSSLTLTVQTPPASGATVSISNNGGFVYTPVENFVGTDTFVYRINDGIGPPVTATAEVVVTSVDDPPTAVGDAYTVFEDGVLSVTATEPLIPAGSIWSYFDEMQNGLQTSPASPAETYPLDNAAEADGTPGVADAWYADHFDVLSSDETIGTWKSGAGPLAGPIGGMAFVPGVTALGGLGNAASPAGANTVNTYLFRRTFTLTGAAGVTGFVADALIDDGAVIYINGVEVSRVRMAEGAITASTLASEGSLEDYERISFDVPPGLLREGTNTIAVEVHQVDLGSSDVGFDLELTAAPGLGLLANDFDLEGHAIIGIVVVQQPEFGDLDFNQDGTFTYTPDDGYVGEDSFDYIVQANGLNSQPATVTITVEAVPDPVVALDDSYEIENTETLIVDAASGVLFNDVGNGALVVRVLDSGGEVVSDPAGEFIWTNAPGFLSDGSFVFTPTADFSGTFTLVYTVEDSLGITGTATLTIEVTSSAIVGDLNGDEIVNAADLRLLLAQFGGTGPGFSADLNDDDAVGIEDLLLLRDNLTPPGAPAASAAVARAQVGANEDSSAKVRASRRDPAGRRRERVSAAAVDEVLTTPLVVSSGRRRSAS